VREITTMLLASNSPRRQELMGLGNWAVSSCAPEVDETRLAGESPADYVLRLAEAKVNEARQHNPLCTYIVGADTAVVDGDHLLGKPTDPTDATRMLKLLRGHVHQVFTGLAVLDPHSNQLLKELCITDVPMRDYSPAELSDYVETGDPMDKAGAYAIQHSRFHPVESLAGCYASVMGLPLCHLLRLLARMQAAAQPDLAARCQTQLNYACTVSSAILRGEPVGKARR
jgi:septum formation protein